MQTTFRPPAVPLVTVDPYFSVWSTADHLYDDHTKHWTFEADAEHGIHGMVGMIVIDGKVRRFAGKIEDYEPPPLTQTNVTVLPLSSIYTFEGEGVTLQVDFTTPLLPDDLHVLSRPASYVTFSVSSNDGREHDVRIYFDITAEWCVHDTSQQVHWSRSSLASNGQVMRIGTVDQPVLKRRGDSTRIDWGYTYMVVPEAKQNETVIQGRHVRQQWIKTQQIPTEDDSNQPRAVRENTPVLACVLHLPEVNSEPSSRFVVLAYDDTYSIEYFHQHLPAYWKKDGCTTEQMLEQAVTEYDVLQERCASFNRTLTKEAASSIGGANYADIVSLAYRQAIAAHKLVVDDTDTCLFLSKECNSNGCIGTVDVSYPTTPLFLLTNPELVKGMLRPIFHYASTPEWTFDFAPHDVGCYPIANGQVYGGNRLENQMPVEECGNMLIMTTAVCLIEGKADFAQQHWSLLSQWAAYLAQNGLDPGNQLCTDDFAGHLAHNANLSIKAIIGIGSYGRLCEMLGKQTEQHMYAEMAREMATKWVEMAADADHYKLTFDRSETWSLKYNLVWDDLFDLNLFPNDVKQTEVAYYIRQRNRYGTPLDNRNTYTKIDWLVWAARLAENNEDVAALLQPVWDFLHETQSRVPLTDWYDTTSGRRVGFKHRSVVGGLFILLLTKSHFNHG